MIQNLYPCYYCVAIVRSQPIPLQKKCYYSIYILVVILLSYNLMTE